MYACLSVCLAVCLFVCQYFCLPVFLSVVLDTSFWMTTFRCAFVNEEATHSCSFYCPPGLWGFPKSNGISHGACTTYSNSVRQWLAHTSLTPKPLAVESKMVIQNRGSFFFSVKLRRVVVEWRRRRTRVISSSSKNDSNGNNPHSRKPWVSLGRADRR